MHTVPEIILINMFYIESITEWECRKIGAKEYDTKQQWNTSQLSTYDMAMDLLLFIVISLLYPKMDSISFLISAD